MALKGKSPLPPLPDGAWRVLYFDAPNRGEQLRLLFALAGTPFEDYRLAFPEGKTPLMSVSAGDAAPLAFDLTPVVQHGSLSIGIVGGSMQYTAEQLGLIPDSVVGRALAVSLVEASEMMRNDVFYKVFFKREKLRRKPETLDTAPYFKWLSHFERFLRRTVAKSPEIVAAGSEPGPFFLGARICYADVAVYDCVSGIWALDLYDKNDSLRRERFPHLCALVDAVASAPGIREYEALRGSRKDFYAKGEAALPKKSNL